MDPLGASTLRKVPSQPSTYVTLAPVYVLTCSLDVHITLLFESMVLQPIFWLFQLFQYGAEGVQVELGGRSRP